MAYRIVFADNLLRYRWGRRAVPPELMRFSTSGILFFKRPLTLFGTLN
jgi:hypothetical protein